MGDAAGDVAEDKYKDQDDGEEIFNPDDYEGEE